MEMMEGVGRRLGKRGGTLLNIGNGSLNGRENNVLFRNNGDGGFTEVAYINGVDRIEDGRGMAIFDYDEDGRLDIALRNFYMPAMVLRNRGDAAHWVRFDLVGTKSNRDAVGARLRLRVGDRWQTRVVNAGSGYVSSSSKRQHFGLGAATKIDEVEIEWPSGERTHLRDLAGNQAYQITEGRALADSR
jgi:hypothetical protein